MHYTQIFGEISGVIGTIAFIPYIRSIIQGETKPNRASWFIWAILGGTILASYHFSGASSTIWLAVVYAIMPVIIFLFSFKYGVGGLERLDLICLAGAALGLLLWKLSDKPEIALYLNILVDSLGFMPTLKKAYFQPASESKLAWSIGVAATWLNLLAINSWRPGIALYPIYTLTFNTLVLLLLFGIGRDKSKPVMLRPSAAQLTTGLSP